MKTAIVWFTTDLRLHDNETLIRAIEENDRIIPVYCFDKKQYCVTEFGFKKTGAFRAQFILEALQDLDENLRQIGSGLLVVNDNTADALLKIVVDFKVSCIYTKGEVAHDELRTQQDVKARLKHVGCELKVCYTSTLIHPDDLPFSTQLIPDTFTSFRTKVERDCVVRPTYARPVRIASPALPDLALPKLSDLNLERVEPDTRAAMKFTGGETYGLARMHYYFENSKLVSTYKETRNQMVGPDYSTKFSAWLAIGCLSPGYISYALKQYEAVHGANESTYWVIFELLWRDFFWFMMMKHGKKYFLRNGIKKNRIGPAVPDDDALKSWVNGKTGVDFIDANMLEMKLTGFMSNRGRQNVASFFCHDLKLDWRYGAAYFEQQLIDYDATSNWCNWAYIAGVGNDPRADRYFNIKKQADQYDADLSFRNLWR